MFMRFIRIIRQRCPKEEFDLVMPCFQGATVVPEAFNSPSAQNEPRAGNQPNIAVLRRRRHRARRCR